MNVWQLLVRDRELRLRMGTAAVEHVKQFSWDVITRKWEEVFVELTKNGSSLQRNMRKSEVDK